MAGLTVTVRLAPLPPNTMLALDTRVVLLLLPLSVREDASVWVSPIVKTIAPVLLPTLTFCAAISEIVGAVLACTVMVTELD